MKKYEVEYTRVVFYEIEAINKKEAIENAIWLYDNGLLFDCKEIDSSSEITTVTEIKGVK